MNGAGFNWLLSALSAVAAVAAAVVAVLAWRAARASATAATVLTQLEQGRWHNELTPRFTVTATAQPGERLWLLVVVLNGPPALDRLDQLTVTIRDDTTDHRSLTGEQTDEQIAAQIWGPYGFAPGVDGGDRTGRAVAPIRLLLGDGRQFQLEPSTPPPWWTDPEAWRAKYAAAPIRLAIHCRRNDNDHEWNVPLEIVPTPAV
jgi:hypothetical protein